jgi:hypothetical protein
VTLFLHSLHFAAGHTAQRKEIYERKHPMWPTSVTFKGDLGVVFEA